MTTTAPPDTSAGLAPGARTEVRALIAITFLTRAAGFSYPFLTYHLTGRTLSTGQAGIVLTLFGAGWLAGSLTWGWLTDRRGRRATLQWALLLAVAALPLLAQGASLPGLAIAAFVAGAAYDAPRPVLSAALAEHCVDDASRTRADGHRTFIVNIAAATAGAAGGALAEAFGTSALMWGNALACALAAAIATASVAPTATVGPEQSQSSGALTDPRLWLLIAATLATLTAAASVFSALPLLMSHAGLSVASYGMAQAANALAVLTLSAPLTAALARRAGRGGPMTVILGLSALVLGGSMLGASFATTTLGFSLCAALAVPGEVAAFIAAGHILSRIAPATAQGRYAGAWGTTLAGGAIAAPLLATWSLQTGGTAMAGVVILAVSCTGAALCWPLHVAVDRLGAAGDTGPSAAPGRAGALETVR